MNKFYLSFLSFLSSRNITAATPRPYEACRTGDAKFCVSTLRMLIKL